MSSVTAQHSLYVFICSENKHFFPREKHITWSSAIIMSRNLLSTFGVACLSFFSGKQIWHSLFFPLTFGISTVRWMYTVFAHQAHFFVLFRWFLSYPFYDHGNVKIMNKMFNQMYLFKYGFIWKVSVFLCIFHSSKTMNCTYWLSGRNFSIFPSDQRRE